MQHKILYILVLTITISCNTKSQKDDENGTNEIINESRETVSFAKVETNYKEELIDSVTGFNYDYKTEGDKEWKCYYKLEDKFGKAIRIDRDYIEVNLVLINGEIPLTIPLKELIDIIGQPDSIVEYINEIEESFSSMLYFPNMVFKRNSSDSLARVESVNFKKGVYFVYKGIEFNEETELRTFKDMFPLSYINSIEASGNTDLSQNNAILSTLRFSTTERQYSDDSLILSFKDNKLVGLWHWEPS